MTERRPPRSDLEVVAAGYDPRRDFDSTLIRSSLELLAERMTGPTVLELGCSTGVTTEWLSDRFSEVHVVDGSRHYLDEVKGRVGSDRKARVTYVHSFWEVYEPPVLFEDVVFAHGLEHVPEPISLLARVRGWLRPGGRLHVVVPNAFSLHRRLGLKMGLISDVHELNERDRALGHQRVYDEDLLRAHLQHSGWVLRSLQGNFLKPFSNQQMLSLEPPLIEALGRLGRDLPPGLCAELYADAIPRSG